MSTKKCKDCLEEKEVSEFYLTPLGHPYPRCKYCHNKYSKAHNKKYPLIKRLYNANRRAEEKSLPFNLTVEHVEEMWTGYCPVFGTKLDKSAGYGEVGGYQMDRIHPELGYVIGNIAWLSDKANRLKNNMTVDEAEMIFKFLKSQEK